MKEDEGARSKEVRATIRTAGRAILVVQVVSQIVSLVVLSCLYRLLEPSAFGRYAMVLPLLLLQRILATWGLSVATVQRAELSGAEVSALFWFNLRIAVAVTVATAATAPAVAWFYDEPDLLVVTLAVAPTALVIGLGAQHQALVERRLQLARLAVARLGAQVAAGIAAIAVALYFSSVWPLVVQQYVELVVLGAACWGISGFRPAGPRHSPAARDLVQFGGYYTVASLLFYIAQNADKVLIGAVLGARALGLYQQAFQLMMKPVYLVTTPLSGMLLPALARARSDDEEFRRVLLAFFRVTAVVLLPAGTGLFVVAPDVMQVLGGDTWSEAGSLLRVLSVAILGQGFFNLAGSVYAATGRADRLAVAAGVSTLVLCQGFAAGLYFGRVADAGALGMGVAYSVVMVGVLLVPYLYFCFRTVGVGLTDFLAVARRPLVAAVAMGAVVAAGRTVATTTTDLRAAGLLAVQVVLGIAVYSAVASGELRWLRRQAVGVKNDERRSNRNEWT